MVGGGSVGGERSLEKRSQPSQAGTCSPLHPGGREVSLGAFTCEGSLACLGPANWGGVRGRQGFIVQSCEATLPCRWGETLCALRGLMGNTRVGRLQRGSEAAGNPAETPFLHQGAVTAS